MHHFSVSLLLRGAHFSLLLFFSVVRLAFSVYSFTETFSRNLTSFVDLQEAAAAAAATDAHRFLVRHRTAKEGKRGVSGAELIARASGEGEWG